MTLDMIAAMTPEEVEREYFAERDLYLTLGLEFIARENLPRLMALRARYVALTGGTPGEPEESSHD